MLESLVAGLLNRFLGAYVKNFDPTQLNIGIWNGDVKLRNLQLKKEALDKFKLPIDVADGYLGQLTLQIPWSNLRGKPVKVLIEDVYLIAAPKQDHNYDLHEEEQRAQALKHEKLESAEILQQRLQAQDDPKAKSFTESLVTKVVDNLQITIKNIHVRYEDHLSLPGSPFALGVTLAEFSAISTDENWQPIFIQNDVDLIHKLATLGSLSMYWHTNTTMLADRPQAELMSEMRNLIATRESASHRDNDESQLLLKPVSGQGRLALHKVAKADTPKTDAHLLFDDIAVSLDDEQYFSALKMLDHFQYLVRRQRYRRFRPTKSLSEDPRAWLKYAGDSVLAEIHDRNHVWTWDHFSTRRNERKEYVALFKSKCTKPDLSPQEMARFHSLEWRLSYNDIRFYRSIARSQLKKQNASLPKQPQPQSQQSWTSWVWGSGSSTNTSRSTTQSTTQTDEPDTIMNDQQRQELYDAIEWDEKQHLNTSQENQDTATRLKVTTELQKGSFGLLRRYGETGAESILSILFENFGADFMQMSESYQASMTLGTLSMFDGTLKDTMFHQFVRVKSEARDQQAIKPSEPSEPLFRASIKHDPQRQSADTALTLQLRSMEIIYNPKCVVEVVRFFRPPANHRESVNALVEAAGATVQGITNYTRAGLELALEEHKQVDLQLDLQSPLIIVPESCTRESNCVILDFGHIGLESNLVSKEQIKEIQSKQKRLYSKEDYDRLKSLMYDRFTLKLESAQMLVGPSVNEATAALTQSSSMRVLGPINLSFMLEMSMLPKVPFLTRFRVKGHLPVLHASVSDTKYKTIMRIIDLAIPDLEPPSSEGIPQDSKQAVARTTSRQPSQSFSMVKPFIFGQDEAVIVQEGSEDDSSGDEDGESALTFEEAREGDVDSSKTAQTQFQFILEIDRLQGSLFKADPNNQNQERLLVEVSLEHFSLDYQLYEYHMGAKVMLQDLIIEDHISQDMNPKFKNIVTSRHGEAPVSEAQDCNHLVSVNFVKVKPQSPEYMSKYEGIDTNLEVVLSAINIVVTSKTVLGLLDFIMVTFNSPEGKGGVEQQKRINGDGSGDEANQQNQLTAESEQKLRIKVDLQGVDIILNHDGLGLATLSFSQANAAIFIMGAQTRVGAKLSSLALTNDLDQGKGSTDEDRSLISIEGNELADFRYETFGEPTSESPTSFDSLLYFHTGSVRIRVVEEVWEKIFAFASKFFRLKALYDSAREAAMNQANQIRETTSRLKFDVLLQTPIFVFPRSQASSLRDALNDRLILNSGEIFATNEFKPLTDSEGSSVVNDIRSGLRSFSLTSEISHANAELAKAKKIIDNVDITFDIRNQLGEAAIAGRPDTEITGSMSDVTMNVTDSQYRFLIELSQSLPAMFSGFSQVEQEDGDYQDLADELNTTNGDQPNSESGSTDMLPELRSSKDIKIDFAFNIGSVNLELFKLPMSRHASSSLASYSLSKFVLSNLMVKLKMIQDGSLESELQVYSFTVHDTRENKPSRFREVIPASSHDGSQFMASFSLSGATEKSALVMLTVDSPTMVFSLEHIFALQDFAMSAFPPSQSDSETSEEVAVTDEVPEANDSGKALEPTRGESSSFNLSFRMSIVDASILLLADQTSAASEAIVLRTKEVVLSQQRVLALSVRSVGLYLTRMDTADKRLRILDDFDIAATVDQQSPNSRHQLTDVQIDISAIVLRLSLRDILLASSIFDRAMELSNDSKGQESEPTEPKGSPKRNRSASASQRRKSSRAASSSRRRRPSVSQNAPAVSANDSAVSAVLRREELRADLKGFRVVLIGDLHELPIFDFDIQPLTVTMGDWSSEFSLDTNIESYINIYNFANSHWEPLVEPWQFGIHATKSRDKLVSKVYSRKRLEIIITAQTVATCSKVFKYLSMPQSDVMTKPRGSDAPYRLKNMTGHELSVWRDTSNPNEENARRLQDGEEIQWRFEDWRKVRETLDTDENKNKLAVKINGTEWKTVSGIPVNKDGESHYILQPKQNVLHRLAVTVHLGNDSVKYITLRSALSIENKTHIPVEAVLCDKNGNQKSSVYKIEPDGLCSMPIGPSYEFPLRIRPDPNFGYTWSHQTLFWRDYLRRSSCSVSCKPLDKSNTPFNFFVHAQFDQKNPLSRVYPSMAFVISPPVEIQNLLPYELDFRIFEEGTKQDWHNHLKKGALSPVHVVDLANTVLLGINLKDSLYQPSSFAIINTTNPDEYRREVSISLTDREGLKLNLGLHFSDLVEGGGAFRVSIYSPYVILNKTGKEVQIKSKSFLQQAKFSAGQLRSEESHKAIPFMFSYNSPDRRNRALLKLGDSAWSKPQSFEAVGSSYEVVLPGSQPGFEAHIGVDVDEGEGKYKLTHTVTLSPRFVLNSTIDEDLQIRQPGTSEVMTLSKKGLLALHFLRNDTQKQLSICYPGMNNEWSAPFNIQDIGRLHVKLAKHGERQNLIRIDIMIEKGTVFIHLGVESKTWPFSVRNESDDTFLFWQSNPYASEDDEGLKKRISSQYQAKRYRLPPKSVMPYAWDFPAAASKELVLSCQGRERLIRPSEIGTLVPMRIPIQGRAPKIFSIDIVGDGPSQKIVIRNYRKSESLYKPKKNISQQSLQNDPNATKEFEEVDLNNDVKLHASLEFEGLGISLINQRLQELAYVTLRGFDFTYTDSDLFQTFSAVVKWVQIDNQLYGGIYPIVLYPSVVPKNGREMDVHPIINVSATKVKDDSYGVVYIKYATTLIQELTTEIDEDFLFSLLEFSKIPGAGWEENNEGHLCDDTLDLPQPQAPPSGQDLFFEVLHLQPMQMNISFVRTERVNVEDKTSSRNPLMFFLNVLTMAIGNINDAPVRLNALLIENARITAPLLMQLIQGHYGQEFIYQVHKILGSADFLGNPVGLFNNLSSGVADIFYEPYQGFVMSDRPQELGIGIARGTASFVKKTVFGVSDSVSKVTGSISKGLSAATLDKSFQDRRRMTRSRNRPKHALFGVTTGANSFMTSVASGFEGIARQPLEGLQRGGTAGFFRGVGKGFLGLATKPMIGVFDLASNVTEGIRNTTTVFDSEGIDKVRLTRFIGRDGIVRPYSQREALGQFWLKQLNNGHYFHEDYLAHLTVLDDSIVMLTYDHIMLVKSKQLVAEWEISFGDLQTVSLEKTGVALILRGGTRGPFVPIDQASSRKFLFTKIGIAVQVGNPSPEIWINVQDYNNKHRPLV